MTGNKKPGEPGFIFLLFRSVSFCCFDITSYQLNKSHRCVITSTETTFQDAGVSTRTLLVTRSQFVEQNANYFAVASTGKCQTAVSDGVAFSQCDQRLNHST